MTGATAASKKLVMIAEDEAIVALSIAQVLEAEGYLTTTACDGRDALDQLLAGARPDVILLDLSMPVMNGMEFRDEQTKLPDLASIPIIACTADGDAATKASFIKAAAWIIKPFNITSLLDTIEKVIGPA